VPREFIGNQDFWLGDPSTSNSINMLQLSNIVLLHAVATLRQASDSNDLPTDDTDNVSEYYISESNWESLSPLNKRKKIKNKI